MSLEELFKKLNYEEKFIHNKGDCNHSFSSRIRNIIDKLDYDSIVFINSHPTIIFKEYKSIEENRDEINKLSKEFWNLSEIPILFIKLNNQYIIYNAHIFEKNSDNIWKRISSEDENSLKEFNYLNLASNEFWKKYNKEFDGKNKVDASLMNNLQKAKNYLIKENLSIDTINNILGRLILCRFLLDRNILKRKDFKKLYDVSFENLILNKEKLYSFFELMKNKFNGNIFEISEREYNEINTKHLSIINTLFKGDELDVYDFSIIPVELISNIYETLLGSEKRKNKGIYYTPLFLVDYIVENTVVEKLKKSDKCKILDPSCGSGIFLVESLRKLIEKQEKPDFNTMCEIVKNNIYGIDIDENAINISIFSIYITLLDYVDDIGEFKFPDLKNKNFFVSDFFNTSSKINTLNDFDCIIGNPPWFNTTGEEKPFEKYCKKNNIPLTNRQIAQAFITRSNDFINKKGLISLIVTSKILYNINDSRFRKYLLENFEVKKFFDMTLVREKIFENSTWPAVIITYKTKSQNDNYCEFISLKPNVYLEMKRIVVKTQDIKTIKQNELIKNDWLFKVLLMGNSLDFEFIKRLKEDYETLGSYIENNPTLISGVGFKKGKSDSKIKAEEFYNKDYLNIKNNDLIRYHAKPSDTWKHKTLERGNFNLMSPPYVLIKQSYNSNFDFISSFSDKELVFDYNTFAIKGSDNDYQILKNITALINSELFKYFFLMTGNVGIDKYRTPFSERNEIPLSKSLINNKKLFNLVELREKSENQLLESEINCEIFNCYELSSIEKDLINYTTEITIPLITSKYDFSKKINKEKLNKYISIYLKSLERLFAPEKFKIKVYITKLVVGISFELDDETSIEYFDDIDEILNLFDEISYEKIGELFVKRDYKIINENSFAIIKTNEYLNWHEANGWMDAGEFLQLFHENR